MPRPIWLAGESPARARVRPFGPLYLQSCVRFAGYLKAVWPDLFGFVFEVWPAPGARQGLQKCGGPRPPHFGRPSRAPWAGQTSKTHPQQNLARLPSGTLLSAPIVPLKGPYRPPIGPYRPFIRAILTPSGRRQHEEGPSSPRPGPHPRAPPSQQEAPSRTPNPINL